MGTGKRPCKNLYNLEKFNFDKINNIAAPGAEQI